MQGEGYWVGRRVVFLRTALCDGAGGLGGYKPGGWCTFCDSMHAVDPKHPAAKDWMRLPPQEIAQRMVSQAPYCFSYVISGGNPAIHDLTEVVEALRGVKGDVSVETQGMAYHPWLALTQLVTVSPKPPSAHRGAPFPYHRFERFLSEHAAAVLKRERYLESEYQPPHLSLKLVVNPHDAADYTWARQFVQRYGFPKEKGGAFDSLYFSCLTRPDDTTQTLADRTKDLVEMVCRDETLPDICILPQLHVIFWGHKLGV